MPDSTSATGAAAPLFSRRNLWLVAAALGTIAVGYAVLASGSPSLAAVLLVVGYIVLLPMALLI